MAKVTITIEDSDNDNDGGVSIGVDFDPVLQSNDEEDHTNAHRAAMICLAALQNSGDVQEFVVDGEDFLDD